MYQTGTVLEVYRSGYMIDTDVLQHAQVKVARESRVDGKGLVVNCYSLLGPNPGQA